MCSKSLTRAISPFLIASILAVNIFAPLSFAQPPTARAQTTHTTQFTYNVYGTLTKITYPDGTIIEYEYGGLGKIKKVKKNGTYIVTDISYGAAEEIISVSLSNGVTTTYTYNPDQLYRLVNKKTTNGALTLQDISYTYDPVGNITGITDTGVGTPKQATYVYDGLNRLTSASIKDTNTGATTSETYSYSKMGRILSTTARGAYQYTNTQHPYAVTQAGNYTYSYDTNGNLVSSTNTTTSETVTYTYDSQNRLTSFTDKTGTTKYYYGDGYARVQKVLPNGKSVTYLGELAEVDEQGKFTTYLFADSIRIATTDSTGTYYHINDHLGSANLLLDANGNVVQKIDYLPFGAERLNEKYASFETKHTFTDQEKDKESGLLYYGARYYDPSLGRFTQPDPVVVDTTRKEFAQALQNPQLQNPYSYVANNPLNFIDKAGEFWSAVGVFVSRAVAAVISYALTSFPSWYNGLSMAVNNPAFHTPEGAVEFTPAGDIVYGAQLARKGLSGGEVSDKELGAFAMGLMSVPSGRTYSKVVDNKVDDIKDAIRKEQSSSKQSILAHRRINPPKAESPVWKDLKQYRGDIKTNDLKGKEREYYKWDHTHNDIEVFDHKGNHVGSKDPSTGDLYKNPKSNYRLEL